MSVNKVKGKITVPDIIAMKKRGEKIACLTSYDFIMARLLNEAKIDLILVGDSVGMVISGYESTIPVTIDEIVYHTRAAARGNTRALLVADMPFMSYQVSIDETVKNAGRCLKEGHAEAVKLEGGSWIVETVSRLVNIGIPVMGHLGLTPQSIHTFGGYHVRAKQKEEADELLHDAKALENAGVFAIVLEKVPALLARKVSEILKIPTIGIGAGSDCDGQILVSQDLLGIFEEFHPKFIRRYAELAKTMRNAFSQYVKDVKDKKFPSIDESY